RSDICANKPAGAVTGIKGEKLDAVQWPLPIVLNCTTRERQPRGTRRPRRAKIATGVKDAPQASLRR
ncbi:MAG: hypothetical protein ACPHJZ_05400, partial [Limisphaerales bacterium]